MKKIIITLLCLINVFAFGKCERCHDKGYSESYFECPLCRGYFFISPAWFDLEVGNTRWTETTYWTGLQTKSDERKKMFSFKKCPLCEGSSKKGGIKNINICSCKNKTKMIPYVQQARKELLSLCKKLNILTENDVIIMSDYAALNAARILKKSTAKGKYFKKLAEETITGKWNIEAADYKRDDSKYKNKVFTNYNNVYRKPTDDVIWIDEQKNAEAMKERKEND